MFRKLWQVVRKGTNALLCSIRLRCPFNNFNIFWTLPLKVAAIAGGTDNTFLSTLLF